MSNLLLKMLNIKILLFFLLLHSTLVSFVGLFLIFQNWKKKFQGNYYFCVTNVKVDVNDDYIREVEIDLKSDPKKCWLGRISLQYRTIKPLNSLKVIGTVHTAPLSSATPQWKKFYETSFDACKFLQKQRAGDLFSKYLFSFLHKFMKNMPKRCPIPMVRSLQLDQKKTQDLFYFQRKYELKNVTFGQLQLPFVSIIKFDTKGLIKLSHLTTVRRKFVSGLNISIEGHFQED